MATIDDMASEAEERDRELCLKTRRKQLKAVGKCYNCLETLKKGVFCDGDCRDDFERRRKFAGIDYQ